MSLSPCGRGPGRPVKRRTRTFRRNYLSFAGTFQCNLACPHCCVPIEWTERLDIGVALRFLEDAYAYGIRILGFTGGEPFIYPEFVVALTRRAAELGFRFDKIMTNGVWPRGARAWQMGAGELARGGFCGKAGPQSHKFPRHPPPGVGRFLPPPPPRLRPRQHRLGLLREPPARSRPRAGPRSRARA